MNFDGQGHLVCTPKELYERVVANPRRALSDHLMVDTPWAFKEYTQYCDFLDAVADRTGIHHKNLYVRGSCHIGFSLAPDSEKVWLAMGHESDLDLVIVDAEYFNRCDAELRRWEARNPVKSPQDRGYKAAERRAQDRQFNCFRDKPLPKVVCAHHSKTMEKVAALAHCGHVRGVSAFLYPDWHSAQERYEFDLRELREGVEAGWLTPPPEQPLPREQAAEAVRSRLAPATERPAPVAAPEQSAPPKAPGPA